MDLEQEWRLSQAVRSLMRDAQKVELVYLRNTSKRLYVYKKS